MREASTKRKTNETDIALKLNVDGQGSYKVDTGVGFFDHMLELLFKHAQFDCELLCKGDLNVDAHHTVEDCGIALGQALSAAMGSKEGIVRYATQFIPMDEALVVASLDISGRPFLVYNVELKKQTTGAFDAELCEEFFRALSVNAGLTLHINMQYGSNTHHIVEAAFKAVGHVLRKALRIDPSIKGVLSTKGVL